MILLGILNVFKLLAIAVGAGASTLITTQAVKAAEDHTISADEENLLRVVFVLLRFSLIVFLAAQAFFAAAFYNLFGYTPVFGAAFASVETVSWLIIAVLFMVFIFIDHHVVSRRVGSIIMLVSWYALIFAWAWPATLPIQIESFVLTYILFGIAAVLIGTKLNLYTVDTHIMPKNENQ